MQQPSPRAIFRPALPLPIAHAEREASKECDARDAEFIQLLDAFRASGGLARGTDLPGLLRHGPGRGAAQVSRWIADGEVLRFRWHAHDWLPMFQFARPGLAPRQAMRRVLAELACVLDEWDLARWFARPNPWLGGALPADLLATRAVQVELAARADRFAFRG